MYGEPNPGPLDPLEVAAQKPPLRFLLFAGTGMGQHSSDPLNAEMMQHIIESEGLDPKEAQERVKSTTSVLMGEPLRANRFQDMIADIERAFKGQEEATIILYSLGAVEFLSSLLGYLSKVQKQRQESGASFEPIDLSHIHLILRSPAGFVKNWADNIRQGKELITLLGSMSTGPLYDLENQLTVPPRVPDVMALTKIIEAFEKVYPDIVPRQSLRDAQAAGKVEKLPVHEQPEQRDWLNDPRFPETLRAELATLDVLLVQAAEKVDKDPEAFQRLFHQRNQLLKDHKVLAQIYGNKDQLLTGKEWKPEPIKVNPFAFFGLFRVLRRAMAPGNIEIYRWLKSRGAKISFIFPDEEVFASFDVLQDFLAFNGEYVPGAVKVDKAVSTPDAHPTLTNRSTGFRQALGRLLTGNTQLT